MNIGRKGFFIFRQKIFDFLVASVKPLTDEQIFYDKFLYGKFYLLVCARNFANFFFDKCTCSKPSLFDFEQVCHPVKAMCMIL